MSAPKKPSAKKNAIETVSLAFDFSESPQPAPAKTEAVKTVSVKPAAAKAKTVSSAPKPAAKTAASKLETAKTETVKTETVKTETVKTARVAPENPVSQASASVTPPKTPKKRRAKVPDNLAEQYGAKVSRRVESGATQIPVEEAPKKRLSKAERAARKELLRPDEGLLERLKRVSTLAPAPKVARVKGWRFECGRCRRVTHFQSQAGLCECGAIAIKE